MCFLVADGGSKEFVFHGFGGDARKLVGGGVMPVGGKPVRDFQNVCRTARVRPLFGS